MKKFWIILLSVGAVLLVLFFGAAWYFSGLILDGARITGETEDYSKEVTAVDGDRITYTDPQLDNGQTDYYSKAIVGMRLEDGGYIQLDNDASVDGQSITRTFKVVEGSAPAVGDRGQMDWNAHPDAKSLGLTSRSISYDSPLGPTPAVLVEPSKDPSGTWAIVVHGRNASVREGLRITPLLAADGMTTMLINYRDDAREPNVPTEDGIGNFGYTEWEDLQAAVEYATGNGAKNVLLVGYSMGGAIIGGYMDNAGNTDAVIGTIMHSPAVSFNEVVKFGAEQMGIPAGPATPLIWTAEKFAEMRANIDFSAVDYIDDAQDWPVPALVTATEEDDLVPPSSVEEFAANVPDGEYVLFTDALHTGEWNTDPELYDRTVQAWLDSKVS